MKKVVHFGAGNIGRGFLGQLYFESGYETVFVEVNPELVKLLNKYNEYPLKLVDDEKTAELTIKNVRAVDGMDLNKVAAEIADAFFISTAVGVNVLPEIAKPIALGLKKRWDKHNFTPINIIVCENMIDADKIFRRLILNELSNENASFAGEISAITLFDKTVGIAQGSIGRMVPIMTDEMKEGNPLKVWAESYSELPVDRDGFKGEIPHIKNLLPYSPFDYFIKRKLYIHNAGHAILAYLGHMKGYRYIYECNNNKHLNHICRSALLESGRALSEEFDISMDEITGHINDLMKRFGNRALKDTVARVGRDPLRKLSADDRLIGAARLAEEHCIVPLYLCLGAAAALKFKEQDDASAQRMQETINREGPEGILKEVCKLNPNEALWKIIKMYYYLLDDNTIF